MTSVRECQLGRFRCAADVGGDQSGDAVVPTALAKFGGQVSSASGQSS